LLRQRKLCDYLRVRLIRELRAGLSPLVNLVYPPRCPLCGVAVVEQGGLCLDCWSDLDTSTNADAVSVENSGHAGVLAACVYNEASRDLILRFKHGGQIGLARLMARMMASHLEDASAEHAPLLIPVPLHRVRLWMRGYNQAALLARELENLGKGELRVDGLIRGKRTPSLGGLSKEERRLALSGSIKVNGSRRGVVGDRDIVLVDDVYTSGATSAACAEALTRAGARSVRVVCFAQVKSGGSLSSAP